MGELVLNKRGLERLEKICNNSSSPLVPHELLSECLDKYGIESNPLIRKARRQALSDSNEERDNGDNIVEGHYYVVTFKYIDNYLNANGLSPKSVFKDNEIRNLLIIRTIGGIIHDFGEEKNGYYKKDPLRIQKEFGLEVSDVVSPMTRPDYRDFPGKNRFVKKFKSEMSYRAGLLKAPKDVKELKIIDRIENTKSSISLFCGLYKGTVDTSHCTEKIMRKNLRYIIESPFYFYLAKDNPELQSKFINKTKDLKFVYDVYNAHTKGKLELKNNKPNKINLLLSYGII
jgi:hypothetical protein